MSAGDPKREEPGWSDWLEGDETVWTGEDRLRLQSGSAREVWCAVLCSYIAGKDPPVRSISDCTGSLGWFHLRLTRRECTNLFQSAVAKTLIEPAPEKTFPPKSDQPEDVVYRLTAAGEERKAPLGAGLSDTLKRTPEVVTLVSTIARIIFGAVVVAFIGGIGVSITSGSPEALVATIWSIWGIVLLFVVGAYEDERALRACAKAWPRMKHYRPHRYKHATSLLRTPLPLAILIWVALAAAWGSAAVLREARTPPDDVLSDWTRAILAAAVVNLLLLIGLMVRSRAMRRAYRAEYERRRPQFQPSEPEPDEDEETWRSRVKRTVSVTIPSLLKRRGVRRTGAG